MFRLKKIKKFNIVFLGDITCIVVLLFLLFYFLYEVYFTYSNKSIIERLQDDLKTNRDQYDTIIHAALSLRTNCNLYDVVVIEKLNELDTDNKNCRIYSEFPQKYWIYFNNRAIRRIEVKKDEYIRFNVSKSNGVALEFYINGFNFKESRFFKDSSMYHNVKYYKKDSIPIEKINWVYQIDENWIFAFGKVRPSSAK